MITTRAREESILSVQRIWTLNESTFRSRTRSTSPAEIAYPEYEIVGLVWKQATQRKINNANLSMLDFVNRNVDRKREQIERPDRAF